MTETGTTHWPALDLVVRALQDGGHHAAADQLLTAVQGSATSGEILDRLGVVLRQQRALRRQLNAQARDAWDAVLSEVNRQYPVRRLTAFLAQLMGR